MFRLRFDDGWSQISLKCEIATYALLERSIINVQAQSLQADRTDGNAVRHIDIPCQRMINIFIIIHIHILGAVRFYYFIINIIFLVNMNWYKWIIKDIDCKDIDNVVHFENVHFGTFWYLFLLIGRIYQTSRGLQQSPDYLQDGGLHAQATLCRSMSNKTTTMPPSSYRQSFANYQNCTIVQSHLPHSNYGTYVSLAPKILIFPVFVQVRSVSVYLPSFLCNPYPMVYLI